MVRSFLLAVAFAMAVAPASPPPADVDASVRGYWLQPVPADDMEAAVYKAATDPATAGTTQAAQALRELAVQRPGGGGAGLARLGAGLLFLDHQQYAEAEPLLLDGGIAKTHLEDVAAKALAELYGKTGEFAKSADQYEKLAAQPDPNPFR
ncbi:MAG TPA: hypothetical protein VGQ33_05085, partial [Vicinamibacteria bacterium]|nr:hypothetical protein [Vicinamibacteria bacterium]